MSPQTKPIYDFGLFRLDVSEHLLLRNGEPIPLPPKAFELLLALIQRRGHLLEKEELMKVVWPDAFVEEANLSYNVSLIRKALGGNGEGQSHIETVPKRGYRFVADVREVRNGSEFPVEGLSGSFEAKEGQATETGGSAWRAFARPITCEQRMSKGATVAVDEIGSPSQPDFQNSMERTFGGSEAQPKGMKESPLMTVGLAMAFVAVLGLYFWVTRGATPTAAKPEVASIAVLPFEYTGTESSDELVGLGMADAIISKLSNVRQITVRPTSAVSRYRRQMPEPAEAARQLRVDAVVEGHIWRSGERVRVTVQLVSPKDAKSIWAENFDQRFTEIFAVEDAISKQVTEALKLKLTGEEQKLLAKHETENREAYQLYVKGVFLRNQMIPESVRTSIECFEQAIAIDPKYARAYVGAAASLRVLIYRRSVGEEEETRVFELINKALELDPTLGEAYAGLAGHKCYFELDWEGAEREFKRAIELNPNEHYTHHLYANYLNAMGRFSEAIAERKRALEIDPFSTRSNSGLGGDLYRMGEYDQAIKQLRLAEAVGHPGVHYELGIIYEQIGLLDKAVAEHLEAGRRWGESLASLKARQRAYEIGGWKGFWKKELELLQVASRNKRVSRVFLAEIYARLEDKNLAFQELDKAYQEREMSLMEINVKPELASLRTDPRFRSLLRRMNLAK